MRRLAFAVVAIGLVLPAVALATFPSVNVNHNPPLLSVDDTNPVTHVNDLTVDIDQDLIRIAEATFPPASDDAECLEHDDGSSLTLHCDPAGISRLEIMLRDGEDTLDLSLGGLSTVIAQVARGGLGDDELRGRSGPQKLKGGDDQDELSGGRGADELLGDNHSDILRGGPGRDLLIGGHGADTCKGGPGNDTKIACE